MQRDKYYGLFPGGSNGFWKYVIEEIEQITEIRIRASKPILLYKNQREISLDEEGKFIFIVEKGKIFEYRDIQKLLDFWCMDSRYAFQEEIKQGFLTIMGGHRVGICGQMVCDTSNHPSAMKYISSLNIRIAHEIKGAAQSLLKYIYDGERVLNTLIISPPGTGKTTVLRDLVRCISGGEENRKGKNVGIVDERGEIAGCFQGIPQLDVGPRCDVLDHCEKLIGMKMLLQSMAPEVMAVDELVTKKEWECLLEMKGRGCAIIATIHGEEGRERKQQKEWYTAFDILVYLSKTDKQYKAKIYEIEEGKACSSCSEQCLLLQDSWE